MTGFAKEHPRCEEARWKTSYPPKKEISFQLDDVDYFGLVTMTAGSGKVIPVDLKGHP
jgi:hypothetical protein